MSKINILPPAVYNRIAAGEVVDRPYSVVKELVENSIDAGASEISIYVEDGGKGMIRVTDNGSGIGRDDLQSAFLPHATSKISRAEDLDSILTLGFRGEAVASIAAVSKMTIASKTEDGKCYSLSSEGGVLGEIEEISGERGTEVTVSDLFFNAPVRLRFLKSDRAEEADITTFVARFILSRPDVAFTYYVNGKNVLQSYGEGDEAAFACVYGAATLNNCYRIDADKHGVKIRGYIGNQNFTKSNKSYQTVFLNGRYVANQTISAAMTNAYANYLMKRQYPFYVLHIDVPPEIVDVNVHPNKADVRFSDNKIIYGCIYKVVSDVLDGNASALDYVVNGKESAAAEHATQYADKNGEKTDAANAEAEAEVRRISAPPLSYAEARKAMAEMDEKPANAAKNPDMELPFSLPETKNDTLSGASYSAYREAEQNMEDVPYVPEKMRKAGYKTADTRNGNTAAQTEKNGRKGRDELREMFSDLYFEPSVLTLNSSNVDKAESAKKALAKQEDGAQESAIAPAAADIFEENRKYLLEKEKESRQQHIDVSSFIYAGKLFNTYLLYEHGDEVYIIDQHAAHERLIFNRLKEKMQNRKTACQAMLVPYTIALNAFEGAFLRENLDRIREMGFDIVEAEENVFAVSGVPTDLVSIDLPSFFHDILGEAGGYRAIRLEDLLKDKLATAACKAAVKGGDDLSQAEIDELFRLIDGNLGLKCPHGRPVVARMTKYELEKMFKRVV